MKTKTNIIMFYTYSLLKFEPILDKTLDTNETILLDIMSFIKNIAGNHLNDITEAEVASIKEFRDKETVLNTTETNYVDFIFAISLFSIYVGKNKEVFEAKLENEIIYVCNLFFQTLQVVSQDKEDLLNKIENSVGLSYEFIKKNKLD